MSKFMAEIVLKSCPFCGGKADLVKTSKGYASGDGAITDAFKVRCSHCFAETESRQSDIRINENGFLEVRRNGAEEAIRLWNKRTVFDLAVYRESEVKQMQKNVYVVTKDGWNMGYGSEIYLLGVFSDKDTAKKIAKEHHAEVTEIEPNKVFPLKHYKDDPECDYNSYCLGGYTE